MAPTGTRRGRGTDPVARLQALTRRAYTATAGHLDLDDDAGREFDRIVGGDAPGGRDAAPPVHRAAPARRWAVSGRAVVVVLVVAAALAGVVVARAIALGSSDALPVPHVTAGTQVAGPDDSEPGAVPPPTGPAAGQGAAASEPPAVDEPPHVVVHVAGAVREPGVVELPAGARVAEAIDAAGGARPAAELSAVNLARPVQDGEQVYVPAVGEAEPGTGAGPAGGPAGPAGPAGGPGGAGAPGAATVVDLNTADLATLDTLPGVGPAIAQRILEWRETHGPFHSVEELLEVSGIGPAILDRLRERARV